MKYDLLIRNATVIDGTHAPRFAAGIAVMNGRIASIGPLEDERADVEIDAAAGSSRQASSTRTPHPEVWHTHSPDPASTRTADPRRMN